MYSAVVLGVRLTRLRPHSRLGDTLLGNSVRYMFMYSAVLKWLTEAQALPNHLFLI